jgi:hypothetical protein
MPDGIDFAPISPPILAPSIVGKPLIVALSTGLLVSGLISFFPIDNFFQFFSVFVLGGSIYFYLTYLSMRREFIQNIQIVKELVLDLVFRRNAN